MIAIDLGSNTVRALKFDCATGEKLGVFEKIVKTADKTHESGLVSEEAIKRVIVAINEAKEALGFTPEEAVGVAEDLSYPRCVTLKRGLTFNRPSQLKFNALFPAHRFKQ